MNYITEGIVYSSEKISFWINQDSENNSVDEDDDMCRKEMEKKIMCII